MTPGGLLPCRPTRPRPICTWTLMMSSTYNLFPDIWWYPFSISLQSTNQESQSLFCRCLMKRYGFPRYFLLKSSSLWKRRWWWSWSCRWGSVILSNQGWPSTLGLGPHRSPVIWRRPRMWKEGATSHCNLVFSTAGALVVVVISPIQSPI